MPWGFTEISNTNTDLVLEGIRTQLNAIPIVAALDAKVEASDMGATVPIIGIPGQPEVRIGSGTARGIVIFRSDPNPPYFSPDQLGSAWQIYTWTGGIPVLRYKGLVDALNAGVLPDGRLLSPASIQYAQICMTQAQTQTGGTLSLFWRS